MAAEVTAGAGAVLAAEQVISTAVQGGTAGYFVAKPTLPLKATYTRIATAEDDHTRRSLARSNHTLTVAGNKGYIFGGNTANDTLASNDIHAVTLASSGKPEMDYSLIPALPSVEGGKVPTPRANHAACAFHRSIAIYGGCDERGSLIDEGSSIWLFNPEKAVWDLLTPTKAGSAPGSRSGSKLVAYENTLILYGGIDASGSSASDVWQFTIDSPAWAQLPTAPVSTTSAALANGQLYLISGSDPMSSKVHHLDITSPKEEIAWDTFAFPTNPIAPGPRARHDGALLPITTGYGRNYLVYFLGERDDPGEVAQWSDMWILQIPSSDLEAKPKLDIKEAIKPAKIKDVIRSALGADSGKWAWAEVEVQVPSELGSDDGKLHPGPRALFGSDIMEDGKSVVFWGGEDAKGERVGDGWIVRLE